VLRVSKIDFLQEILQKRVSVDDALARVDECGAPLVSIPRGTAHSQKFPQIVSGIVARGNSSILCTNAILLAKHIDDISLALPDFSRFTWTAIAASRRIVARRGSRTSGGGDRIGQARAFRVTINCTLFNGETRRCGLNSSTRDGARRRR